MKKAITILALAITLLLPITAYASIDISGGTGSSSVLVNYQPATFNVTLPTVLPISVNPAGVVTTAQDVSITNDSAGPIKITGITITPKNGWGLRDWATDFSTIKAGTKAFAFSLNGIAADSSTGSINADMGVIPSKTVHPFNYNAKTALSIDAVAGQEIADVMFVADWESVNTPNPTATPTPEPTPTPGPVYNVTDFYTYTDDPATGGWKLGLTDSFSNALTNKTDYKDWTFNTALPNPGSTYDGNPVTNLSGMFYNSTITALDLSSFNTSNVIDMSNLFQGCTNLTSLNLSGFNTSHVTNMTNMFYNCHCLTSLNLGNFNTSSVTTMSGMFTGCFVLTSLDISNFDTSNVTNMSMMFCACQALTNFKINGFNTKNVTNMSAMFQMCFGLTNFSPSNFNTAKVTDMSSMFFRCTSLTSLDLSSFDTSNVTNMMGMFILADKLSTGYARTTADATKLNAQKNIFTVK